MPNIMDYLKWRGDLSFKQDDINEIDNIIFARFSYLPFKDINLLNVDNIESISNKMSNLSLDKFIWKEDKEFIIELGKTKRYKNLVISNYEEILDIEAEKQFAAITIWLPNKYKYVSFRGTDMSLVGWKEDFNMSFMQDIPSQKEAVKYLEKIGKLYKDKLIVGGHSKGGNLAIYSAIHCNKKVKNKIEVVINADGPGFDKSIILSESYKKIVDKIHTYIPQSSVIGRLLEHEDEYQVIKSEQLGIMQHDMYSWQVDRNKLIRVSDLTDNSKMLNKVVKNWLESTTSERRENFINIIYEVIISSEAENINDFGVDTIKKITKIIKSYRNINKEDKKEIEEMIKLVFQSIIMKLLFATGNENKYQLMKRRLNEMKELEVIMPKYINLKIEINEDGKTAEENAVKKAKAYYDKINIATIAEDSGLWIEKFSEEEQPGLYVKRVNGKENLSDEEILNFYIEKLQNLGGTSNARYKTGVAIIDERGRVISKTIDEELFILTANKNNKSSIKGGLLDCISYDPINKKYFNELTEEEKAKRYEKIDEEIRIMIKEILK